MPTPNQGDTRLRLWKKILAVFQSQPGALPENDPKPSDTMRRTLYKILRALNAL